MDDNMSNLTSAISNEASISSSNNLGIINPAQPASKKRRNLPGNPDPEAEVVALSPRSLMATNRFVCEICHKGFQRDQNLQLHRRGHNLPWKLKQRNKLEVIKKKVYVCPESSCVHHEASRALGDLTGIKKHFFRKHGEKKWKCDKCSKRYAVQSDWKAHSKICGTREYRCDCGTIFSRRDSFITHRAFCDALAQESSRISITQQNPIFNMSSSSSQTAPNQLSSHHQGLNGNFHLPSLKQENVHSLINLPPWLSSDPGGGGGGGGLFASGRAEPSMHHGNLSAVLSSPPPLMSATALLQKAAQMGVTMGSSPTGLLPYNHSPPSEQSHHHLHQQGFNATSTTNTNNSMTGGMLSRATENNNNNNNNNNFVHGLSSYVSRGNNGNNGDMSMVSSSLPSTSGGAYGGPSTSMGFEESFNEMMNASKRDYAQLMMGGRKDGGAGGGGEDGMTRDFLGLRGFPDHRDFLNMAAGFDQMGSANYDDAHQHLHQPQNQGPWQS